MTDSNVVRRVLPVEVGKAITSAVRASLKGEGAISKAADLLFSLDVASTVVCAAAKGHDDDILRIGEEVTTHGEFYTEVKEDIVLGFSAANQRLLEKPTKGLDPAKKAEKRYWQGQIGSKAKDLRRALARREKAANGEEAGTPSRTRDINTRINEYINGAIKAAQAADPKKDGVKFDVTKLVAKLEEARTIANTAI